MNKMEWTKQEIDFLKKNVRKMPTKDIAKKMGRSIRSIAHKIAELKLKSLSHYLGHYWNKRKKGSFSKGHYVSKKTRRKIGLGNKGKIIPQETREKISESSKGRKFTTQHKRRISLAIKGRKIPLEQKQKQSETMKRLYEIGKIKLNSGTFKKGQSAYNKGKKLEETFGKEKAKKIKKKIGKTVVEGRIEHPDIMVKIREARMEQKFPTKETSIEVAIFEELTKRKIPFEKHKTIVYNDATKKFCQPDAFIKPNICIFADGDYWHKRPESKKKDLDVNKKIKKQGFKVLRFWEHQINKDVSECVDKIERVIKHKND